MASILWTLSSGFPAASERLENHLKDTSAIKVRQSLKALGLPAMDNVRITATHDKGIHYLYSEKMQVIYRDDDDAISSIRNRERSLSSERRKNKGPNHFDSNAKWIAVAHGFAKKVWTYDNPKKEEVQVNPAGSGLNSVDNFVGVIFQAGSPQRQYTVIMDRVTGELLSLRRHRPQF